MRKMGGLKKYMPITAATAWIGSLALIWFPFFSGFFSTDMIIDATRLATRPGSGFAYFAVMAGVVVTALYTFRMLYLTFHGPTRMDDETRAQAKETSPVITVPLILLAVASLAVGYFTIQPLLFGGALSDSIVVLADNDVVAQLADGFRGPLEIGRAHVWTPVTWPS